MPTPKEKRDYQAEYARETPERRQARRDRNNARYAVEKKVGDLPSDKHVDHKRAISQGGTNAPSNLRVVDKARNESFKRAGPGGKQVGRA
jgi:5-methylcytosine-specific restriction endonuclease McrA